MMASDIKWLHVESSSKCNAWCPACPRNNSGYGVVDFLTEQDINVDKFRSVVNSLPSLHAVQFCGNYGDPLVGNNFLELIDICIDRNLKIQVHTNGSVRSEDWWASLGKKLSGYPHDIWFGIDGIGETHEIYRQATSYTKIINNATTFINNGGNATWQFIPYLHNQHQIKDALILSKKLNFKNFKLVKFFRNNKIVRHWKTGEEFILSPPSDILEVIQLPSKKQPPTIENCMHLTQPSIYMDANGMVSFCCYFKSKQNMFDNVSELLESFPDFNNKICIESCGSSSELT